MASYLNKKNNIPINMSNELTTTETQYASVGQVNFQGNTNIANNLSITLPFMKLWLSPLLQTRFQLSLLITCLIMDNNFTSPYHI